MGVGVLIVQPASAFASSSIGGRPGLPREDEPRSQSIFLHTIKIGGTAKDKILLSNRSDKKQTIDLYAVDAITTNTGSFTCKQRVEKKTDAGAWIKLAKTELTLAPDESELVDFSITVPEKSDVGEHNACLVFAAKDDVEDVDGSLRIRTRSAVRLAVTIPGKLERGVNIQDFRTEEKKGVQTFTLQARNTGNVSADTNIQVALKTLYGVSVYKNGGQYPVLPSNSLEVTYQNDASPFWGGWYKATASISYDQDAKKWGTSSDERLIKEDADSIIVFVTPKPLALAVYVALLVVIAAATSYWWSERRRVQLILNTWQKFIVDDGDTIESLAAEHKVNWKLITKINDLKPPYTLKAGTNILLPGTAPSKHKKKKTRKA